MAITLDATSPFSTWQASDWSDLQSTWADLLPKGGEKPRFQSEELSAPQAGYVFERLIIEAFRFAGARIHYPYSIPTEKGGQIREQEDGLVVFGWQGFIVESKCWTNKVGIDPIFRLHILVDHRPIGTLGLFFSAFGYTDPAIESSEYLRPIRVLLFQPDDLAWAFGSPDPRRMRTMVERKWSLALKLGKPHLPVAEYDEETGALIAVPTGLFGEPFDDAFF